LPAIKFKLIMLMKTLENYVLLTSNLEILLCVNNVMYPNTTVETLK